MEVVLRSDARRFSVILCVRGGVAAGITEVSGKFLTFTVRRGRLACRPKIMLEPHINVVYGASVNTDLQSRPMGGPIQGKNESGDRKSVV